MESLVGVLAVVFEFYIVPVNERVVASVAGHPYAHAATILYLMATSNLIFVVMLLVAGTFLWNQKRTGLMLLV